MKSSKVITKDESKSVNGKNGGNNVKTNAGRDSDYCDLSLDEAIEEFIYAKESENVTKVTIENYDYAFSRFQAFLNNENPNIGQLDKSIFRQYLSHLKDKGLSPFTVECHYRHLNGFFNWLVNDGYLESNPLNRIKKPKTSDNLPQIIEEKHVKKLLETAKSSVDRWSGQRNYAMLVVFIEMMN